MTALTRLGGFKVLDGMAGFSLILPKVKKDLPTRLSRAASQKNINFPYFTLVNAKDWGITVLVESVERERLSHIIDKEFGNVFHQIPDIAVLSIFPHKKNPDVIGRLVDVLGKRDLTPYSLANSPSAISVVIKEDAITKAGRALFEPFSFSSYRTPADWKLAQIGKEELHKEIVATYQELKPKVYGLEYINNQVLLKISLEKQELRRLGVLFKEFAHLNLSMNFSTIGPIDENKDQLVLCLPLSKDYSYPEIIDKMISNVEIETLSPVAIFSMNGPHFGDRYGIIYELLSVLEKHQIDLLGLSCTVASITGVVPTDQTKKAIQSIQESFEVPSILNRT